MVEILLLIVRGAVALCCGAAGVVALTHWAVRRGTLSRFGAWPRFVYKTTGGLLRPIEQRLLGLGGNPQHAPYWLLGIAVAGGLVLISTTQWVLGYWMEVSAALLGGPRRIAAFVVAAACDLLTLALFIRVIGSWFGIGRWTPWMRPFHQATDWFLRPLQRIIPPIGAIDVTPIVAYLLIGLVIRPILLSLLR